MPQGFVYVLVSPNSSHIKIGGTEHPINKRLREINGSAAYGDHGPWQLSDFLHVTDWRLVEGQIHEHFRTKHVRDVARTRELFSVPPHEARQHLRLKTDAKLRVGHDKTLQLFKDDNLQLYLFKIFQLSGLFGHLDIQGAWTLSILTKTMGGRWFTLNIGPHEVAFSTRQARVNSPVHHIVVDQLILDFSETIKTVRRNGGTVYTAPYKSARERAVSIEFQDDFASAEKLFGLSGSVVSQ